MALAGLMEYVLHLTRLNPDMIYIHQDTGLINVAYFKFDVDDMSGELMAKRPVPFRLTPTLAEFITSVGINGPLTASMVAAARCLAQPSFKVINILRAILRDEMISWHKKVLLLWSFIFSESAKMYPLADSNAAKARRPSNIGHDIPTFGRRAAGDSCIEGRK